MIKQTEITIIRHVKPPRPKIVDDADQEIKKKIKAIKEHVLTTARILQNDVRVEISERRGGYELKTVQIPLDHYIKSRVIEVEEYQAGNRLFKDFYLSGQTSNLTVNLNPMRAGEVKAFLPSTDMQREALDRWRKAMNSVHGLLGKLMVQNVCCYGYWLGDTTYGAYNERSAMHRFREALGDLIEFYKTS